MELLAKENKVNIYTFPEEVATETFSEQLMNIWRDGGEVPFSEGFSQTETELSVSESILPEDLKVERGDLIQRAQTEWHFVVLSSKLHEAYESELDELRERIGKQDKFDQQVWDELKGFWNKVQKQVREKNLFREHANTLRDHTNELFGQMKELRNKLDEEFLKYSKTNHDKFISALETIEQKISDGLRLQGIFDDLKGLQRKFRDSKLTRDHRTKVWERLDAAFKTVKEKRFGSSGDARSPVDRLQRRYEGLLSAIEKMERSISRDRDDLEFQDRKIASTDGQLEAQIRKAKILMIEERIRSKEEKLSEMHVTQKELERRMEVQKNKEAKRLEHEQIERAKREAQEKIAQEIKDAAEARKEEAEKLEKAAEAIVQPEKPDTADTDQPEEQPQAEDLPQTEEPKESILEAIGATVSESMEDLSDTIKAVAKVVGEQIEETIDDLKEEFSKEEETTEKKQAADSPQSSQDTTEEE